MVLYLNKIESTSKRFCQVWLKLAKSLILQKEIFKFLIVFSRFLDKRPMGHIAHQRKQFKSINTYDYMITLIKRKKNHIINFMRIYWFFIWINLNPPHPRMLCAKFGWNWPSGFGEFFFEFRRCSILLLSPLRMCFALHLNKGESHSPKDA